MVFVSSFSDITILESRATVMVSRDPISIELVSVSVDVSVAVCSVKAYAGHRGNRCRERRDHERADEAHFPGERIRSPFIRLRDSGWEDRIVGKPASGGCLQP